MLRKRGRATPLTHGVRGIGVDPEEENETAMAAEVSVTQLAIERENGATVIDVREVHEYLEARVPGVQLVPLATVPDALDALPRDTTLYVICRSGVRSQYAADYLNDNGFDAISVAGGTIAWIQQGFDYETGDDQ